MYCPNCGAQVPEGGRYCGRCGADLGQHIAPGETESGSGEAHFQASTQESETITEHTIPEYKPVGVPENTEPRIRKPSIAVPTQAPVRPAGMPVPNRTNMPGLSHGPSPFGWAAGRLRTNVFSPGIETPAPPRPVGAPPPALEPSQALDRISQQPGERSEPPAPVKSNGPSPLEWSARIPSTGIISRPPGQVPAPPAPLPKLEPPKTTNSVPSATVLKESAFPGAVGIGRSIGGGKDRVVAKRSVEDDLEEHWLFRKDGIVYGPFSGRDMANKIETGELSEDWEISEDEGEWRLLRDSQEFWPVVARAKAKLQAQRARLAAEKALKREALLKALKIGGIALGALAVMTSLTLVAINLFSSEYTGKEKKPLVAESSETRAVSGNTVTKALNRRATRRNSLKEHKSRARKNSKRHAKDIVRKKKNYKSRKGGFSTRQKKNRKSANRVIARASNNATSRQGPDKKFKNTANFGNHVEDFSATTDNHASREAINRIIAKSQVGLKRCIRAEVRRNSNFEGDFTVDFTITAAGRAGSISLGNLEGNTPKFLSCIRAELGKWQFPSKAGFQVSLPFSVNR
ncbi:MAG: zinc ribbon domain-containing protein [Deltaproteobacteria bacterium]|nr:zinc ribbon domain-containing protein [Deltaproteobacteria bacterium]